MLTVLTGLKPQVVFLKSVINLTGFLRKDTTKQSSLRHVKRFRILKKKQVTFCLPACWWVQWYKKKKKRGRRQVSKTIQKVSHLSVEPQLAPGAGAAAVASSLLLLD